MTKLSTQLLEAAPRKTINPSITVGCKARHDNGEYGIVERIVNPRTVVFNGREVPVKSLRSVGVHKVNFFPAAFNNYDPFPAAKAEADFIGPGARVYAGPNGDFNVVPGFYAAWAGATLVYTAH